MSNTYKYYIKILLLSNIFGINIFYYIKNIYNLTENSCYTKTS